VRLTHSWKGRKNLASYVKGRGTSESEEKNVKSAVEKRDKKMIVRGKGEFSSWTD